MSRPETVFASEVSPFFAHQVERQPHWLELLQKQGRLDEDSPPRPDVLGQAIEQHGLDRGLRRFRNREMLRIIWREVNRKGPPAGTLMDLSQLAELCLQASLDHHWDLQTKRYGAPCGPDGEEQHLLVLGLGKLGGRELNLSSDIDLIFCYPGSGECTGPRALSSEQFFTRLVRAMIKSLADITEDGFCFRVDTRLRPFGEAGPLVSSLGALEQYYQREGRGWERYALVKARPVAGDLSMGSVLLDNLKPFIYRRYIDYGAVESLREMLDAIRADAARRGREHDVKRGQGGIREIEFLVQCVQLLRGGREPGLQTQSLFAALDELKALALLPEDRIRQLREDYVFLRHVENSVQALHDQQTHSVPAGDDHLRVARANGFEHTDDFDHALAQVRERVSAALDERFPRSAAADEITDTPWRERLAADPKAACYKDFLGRLSRMALSPRAVDRLDQFMPRLLDIADQHALNDAVMEDLLALTLAICKRSAYLALLVQNPAALQRLQGLFTQSHWVAESVTQYPALLDELIDPALGLNLPDRNELTQTTARLLRRQDDPEQAMNTLNYVKRAQSLRVAAAELGGHLSARQAEHHLTVLAEILMAACLSVSRRGVAQRHGVLPGDGLAIIGYGSLGGGDISYNSDLDLVFLYPVTGSESDGARPLSAETYYTRWVRRLLALSTTASPTGRLYEVDTRLRPNGRSGLLVSSLSAFERYQHEKAWVWELQALTRARFIGGDANTGGRFEKIRRAVLTHPKPGVDWVAEVSQMRQKMRASLPPGDPLKHQPGGLVDIGFLVQLGVLLNAPAHPELLNDADTHNQLRGLGQIGWLKAEDAEHLVHTREQLMHRRHLLALQRKGQQTDADTRQCAEIIMRYGLQSAADVAQ